MACLYQLLFSDAILREIYVSLYLSAADHNFSASLLIKYLNFVVINCTFLQMAFPVPQCPTGLKIQQVTIFGMLP